MEKSSVKKVRRIALKAQEKIFVDLVRRDRIAAGILQPHYHQYLEAERAVFKEHPDGKYDTEDVRRRIPHNLWIEYVTALLKKGIR